MLQFPHLDPVALTVGPVAVHWYGIMYLIGFAAAWLLAVSRSHQVIPPWTKEQIGDLIFYGALGVIVGGRFGYVLFYDTGNFFHAPWIFFKIWQGGMSFHGGMLGVIGALWLYSKKLKRPFHTVIDFIVPMVPIGLGMGRLGNFINGELWGRVTTVPWGMIFPDGGALPRHPSELYEFFCEGVFLFLILWFFSKKPRKPFAISGLFLLCYGSIRFLLEFFRQPDIQLGFIAWNWLTMGQLLSLPMILGGAGLLIWTYRRKSS